MQRPMMFSISPFPLCSYSQKQKQHSAQSSRRFMILRDPLSGMTSAQRDLKGMGVEKVIETGDKMWQIVSLPCLSLKVPVIFPKCLHLKVTLAKHWHSYWVLYESRISCTLQTRRIWWTGKHFEHLPCKSCAKVGRCECRSCIFTSASSTKEEP